MNKKGQIINMLSGISIAVLTIAIVLVVGFLIMAQGKDIAIDNIALVSVINESVVYTENTFVALTGSNGIELSCSAVWNGTGGDATAYYAIAANNWTCSTAGLNLTGSSFNDTVQVHYTYKLPSYAYNSTSKLQNATSDIPGWLPIIIITMIGAGLIGLVSIFKQEK